MAVARSTCASNRRGGRDRRTYRRRGRRRSRRRRATSPPRLRRTPPIERLRRAARRLPPSSARARPSPTRTSKNCGSLLRLLECVTVTVAVAELSIPSRHPTARPIDVAAARSPSTSPARTRRANAVTIAGGRADLIPLLAVRARARRRLARRMVCWRFVEAAAVARRRAPSPREAHHACATSCHQPQVASPPAGVTARRTPRGTQPCTLHSARKSSRAEREGAREIPAEDD